MPQSLHGLGHIPLAGHGGAGAGEGLSRHYGARGRSCHGGALEWTRGLCCPYLEFQYRLLELVRGWGLYMLWRFFFKCFDCEDQWNHVPFPPFGAGAVNGLGRHT